MRAIRSLAGVVTVLLLLAACSSGGSAPASGGTTTTEATATGTAGPDRACRPDRPPAPEVVPVAGSEHDLTMTSFDGARIRLHWFPVEGEHPVVLMGPGWGEAGATEESGTGLFGDSPIGTLQALGLHVLTWDPRGFGESTGTVTVDAARHEGRDVRRIVDWLATRDGVTLDGPGDPRVGMVGGSYGGGIQLVTASIDCRIDAIVPTIAWHSLRTSLNKADTVKIGWSSILYEAARTRDLDPHIRSAYEQGRATGVISAENRRWFTARGPGAAVARITAPTLLIQGTVDTLFTLDEAARNYRILRDRGVPVQLLWYCGGHGVCLTDAGDPDTTQRATAAWLRAHLLGDTGQDTGARVDLLDQHGTRYETDDFPPPPAPPLVAEGTGHLDLAADGGSGPATPNPDASGPIDAIAAGITPARATRAVEVTATAGTEALLFGAPVLTLEYSGTTPAGARPTRVFAQLVDATTGLVVGNQVTPIAVTLDGRRHRTRVPLEMIGHRLAPGEQVTLQLVATTVAYAPPRLGGAIDFSRVHLALPAVTGLTAVGG